MPLIKDETPDPPTIKPESPIEDEGAKSSDSPSEDVAAPPLSLAPVVRDTYRPSTFDVIHNIPTAPTPYPQWHRSLPYSVRMDNVIKLAQVYRLTESDDTKARGLGAAAEAQIHNGSSSRDEYDAEIESVTFSLRNDVLNVQPPTCLQHETSLGTPNNSTDIPTNTNKLSSKYTRCSLIGQGTSSHVYLVHPTPESELLADVQQNNGYISSYVAIHPPLAKVVKAVFALVPAPHSPFRERLALSNHRLVQSENVIDMLDFFTPTADDYGWGIVLPYFQLNLDMLLHHEVLPPTPTTPQQILALSQADVPAIFHGILSGLRMIHLEGFIHRDLKPSAILMRSPRGPAVISDFGTAFLPDHPFHSESETQKILDIGTGPYRAPEALFGLADYDTKLDIWAVGCILAEAIRRPHKSLFDCPPAHEDGSQLALIRSIFGTWGLPSPNSWPKVAAHGKVKPWDLWHAVEPTDRNTIFPPNETDPLARDLVEKLVVYDEGLRLSACDALRHQFFVHFHNIDARFNGIEENPRRRFINPI